jgi:2-dehydro-3-deoxygluconokinase
MTRVVTLGEVMLRLKSPGFERLFQSAALEATFGGAEANVAVSVSNYGLAARFVSALPANQIADACLAELRSFGVDTGFVLRQGERIGIYFLEGGANQRASKVTYDRVGSAIATARPGTSTGVPCSRTSPGSVSG